MSKASEPSPTRIKIGGVEVILRRETRTGTIPEEDLRRAVAKAVALDRERSKKKN